VTDLFKYCPHCAGHIEYKSVPNDTHPRHICATCNTIHYVNPKIVTGVLPIYEGQVLLARRSIEPRQGYWNVPAGYMENGETVEAGAERELWEEANAKVENIRPHLIYSIAAIHQVYMLFLGDLKGPNFSPGDESLEVKLFSEEGIPWKELAFTSSAECIKKYFENVKNNSEKVHLGQYIHPKNL